MSRFINTGILKHPLNWITLLIWLAVLGYVIHLFHPTLAAAYAPQNGATNQ